MPEAVWDSRIHDTHESKIRQDRLHIIRQRFVERNFIRLAMQQDVAWFDIPMNDALFVSIIEGGGQPFEETRHLMRWNALFPFVHAPQIIRKRWTLQILHYNIRVAVCGIEIKDLNDVGMP